MFILHEALGFWFEGRLRNIIDTNGEYLLYFGLAKAECDQLDLPST